jgi:hypothetical protein
MAESTSPPGLGPIRPDVSHDVMPFSELESLCASHRSWAASPFFLPLALLFFLFTLLCFLARGVFLLLLASHSNLVFLEFDQYSTQTSPLLNAGYDHSPLLETTLFRHSLNQAPVSSESSNCHK